MPGIFPSNASSRKQILQRLKSRKNPLGRPHLKQRRITRLLNFGFRCAFTTIDLLAMCFIFCGRVRRSWKLLHPGLAAQDYGSFFAWLCSSSNLWLKNKAPNEALKIYARWLAKSTTATKTIAYENFTLIYQENHLSLSWQYFCPLHLVSTSDFRRTDR